MSPKVRNSIYVALGVVNTVLLVCSQQNAIPVQYAHYVALASIVVAAVMKEFGSDAAAAPAAPPAAP